MPLLSPVSEIPPLAVPPPSRDQLVACSAGWVAVALNLGCQGLGYVYQRRWRAFWIGGTAAVAATVVGGIGGMLVAGSLAQGRLERDALVRTGLMAGVYGGLFGVGVASSVEAGLAVRRARRRLVAAEGA